MSDLTELLVSDEPISLTITENVDTVIEETPIIQEVPLIQEPPVEETPIEETPIIQEVPLIQEPPVEETPIIQETPIEETPIIQEVPLIQEPPVEETPIIQETPIEETPIIQEVPLIQEPPVEIPVVEEPPVEIPVVEEKPIIQEPPVEIPVVEEPPVEIPVVEEKHIIQEPPVEETPIIQETPIEETPVEEKPIIQEPPVEIPVVEEKPIVEEVPVTKVTTIYKNGLPSWEYQKIQHTFQLNFNARKTDPRDYTFHFNEKIKKIEIKKKGNTILKLMKASQPTSFSFQSSMSSILNQGNIGTCVVNALAMNIITQTNNVIAPSRLFLYANCRILQGSLLSDDSGTDIPTVCRAILNYGTCKEANWPYNTNNFSVYPPLVAFQYSKKFLSFTYTFVSQTLASLQTALYTNKTPIVFGFLVYSSFMTNAVANNGIVPIPNTKNETFQGGHCINIVGYDDSKKWFICANSWGTSWGDKGYCYIPYDYLLNAKLAFDFCQPTFVY
jgi:C1A family cysteine protease